MTVAPRTSSAGKGYRVTVPAPRQEWTKAVLADPNSQAFQSPEYVQAVCAAGGFRDVTRLYETPDGRHLVLPLVSRAFLGGALCTQGSLMPYWGVGGVISADGIRPEDLAVICSDLRRDRRVLRTFIRPTSRSAAAWLAADLPGTKVRTGLGHVLDLDGGFETVWNDRFTKSGRRMVRRAEKAGVVVEVDPTGARLPEYFAIVEASIRRWARQQHEPLALSRWRARQRQSTTKMRALAAAVPDRFRLYLAMLDGRAIAGNVVFQGTGTRATSGAMIKELAGPVGAMHLLERVAIEAACAAGSTHYDLGESGGSAGLAMYKTRFGAQPQPYPMLFIERLPLAETDRLLREAAKRVIGFQEPPPVSEGQPGEPPSRLPAEPAG